METRTNSSSLATIKPRNLSCGDELMETFQRKITHYWFLARNLSCGDELMETYCFYRFLDAGPARNLSCGDELMETH